MKQIKYEKQVADLAGTFHLEKQEKTFFKIIFKSQLKLLMLFSKLLQLMLYYLTAKMKHHFQYQLFQYLFHHCEIRLKNFC